MSGTLCEDKDNIVTTDASTTGLGVTFGKKYSIGGLDPLEKFRFYL